MNKKNNMYRAILLITAIFTTVIYQNCGALKGNKVEFSSNPELVLQSNPFGGNYTGSVVDMNDFNYDGNSQALDNIQDYPDAIPYNLNATTTDGSNQITDCSQPGRFEEERSMALAEANKDLTGQTIPVQYSYSFGNKYDNIAEWANKRAILSHANPGVTYLPVGPKDASKYKKNGTDGEAYYTADHDKAKQDFLNGQRCFFSTIQVNRDELKFLPGAPKYDFIPNSLPANIRHIVHYMFYGWCNNNDSCQTGVNYAGDYANRLFKEVPSQVDGQRQIVKLYLADFRDTHFGFENILQTESYTVRGSEQVTPIHEILNLDLLLRHKDEISWSLSNDHVVSLNGNQYTFEGMQGMTQVLNNFLVLQYDGIVLSTQYTPIVLDLGNRGIKTSSIRWGTFFNMAALVNLDRPKNSLDRLYVPHRTAWLGGVYKYFTPKDAPKHIDPDVRIVAEDGFLVIPEQDGQVRSSANMFGDNMLIDGKYHENGFKALQALAKKDCSSSEVKKRFFGPWDGTLFDSQIKVWVDSNRNGFVDSKEINSLNSHGVLAINTCNIVHKDQKDKFGNDTALRSLFLKKIDSDGDKVSEEEILKRIKTNENANYRLAIDIIFKTNEKKLLYPMNTGRKGL